MRRYGLAQKKIKKDVQAIYYSSCSWRRIWIFSDPEKADMRLQKLADRIHQKEYKEEGVPLMKLEVKAGITQPKEDISDFR